MAVQPNLALVQFNDPLGQGQVEFRFLQSGFKAMGQPAVNRFHRGQRSRHLADRDFDFQKLAVLGIGELDMNQGMFVFETQSKVDHIAKGG